MNKPGPHIDGKPERAAKAAVATPPPPTHLPDEETETMNPSDDIRARRLFIAAADGDNAALNEVLTDALEAGRCTELLVGIATLAAEHARPGTVGIVRQEVLNLTMEQLP